MTPMISLGLLGIFIVALGVVGWWVGLTDRTAIVWQTAGGTGAAIMVWLLNLFLWPGWSDCWAMLGLLVLESVALSLVSWLVLRSFSLHIPTKEVEPLLGNAPVAQTTRDGVVHLRRFRQPRGVLPSGVAVVWNEWRGGWSSLETALEDERNALAS